MESYTELEGKRARKGSRRRETNAERLDWRTPYHGKVRGWTPEEKSKADELKG